MDLIRASRTGKLVNVRKLLSSGVDPNTADENSNTALYWASYYGHLEVVKELLFPSGGGKEANPNIANEEGRTPLSGASGNGHLEVVKELLSAGADPDIIDEDGETPLHWALDEEYLEVVEELENFFPTLRILSLRSIRKFKIYFPSMSKFLF